VFWWQLCPGGSRVQVAAVSRWLPCSGGSCVQVAAVSRRKQGGEIQEFARHPYAGTMPTVLKLFQFFKQTLKNTDINLNEIIKTQSVPRSKHTPSGLYKPVS